MGRLAFLTTSLLAAASALAAPGRYDAVGADNVRHVLVRTPEALEVRVFGAGVDRPDQMVFIALGDSSGEGSPLAPSDQAQKESAVWLPFAARVFIAVNASGKQATLRQWDQTAWGPPAKTEGIVVVAEPAQVAVRIPSKLLGPADRVVVYLKDSAADEGRGRFYGSIDPASSSGPGERSIRHFLSMTRNGDTPVFRRSARTPPDQPRPRIYQLLPRLFGNANETRRPGGGADENGVGKFDDLGEKALDELKAMGFTHVWLTGVLQQATATDHSGAGEPPDDPDLLKGAAGSPYAIRDYFDLCPDYAQDPAKRKEEFEALVGRIHSRGMKVLIDFVPNHVARSYASNVRPDLTFGAGDDRGKFFDAGNNFFYLTPDSGATGGRPLRLPVPEGTDSAAGRDGLFEGEKETGRVTGNDVISWAPPADSWYETVKLNYGYDFAKKTRHYPHGGENGFPVPDTWKKMDEVISYWQGLGVDGFRADMAHMVPPEFWHWLIVRARQRNPEAYFLAEAYAGDAQVPSGDTQSAAVTRGEIMAELLKAGFDAVYDDPSYDALKNLFDGAGSADELDKVRPRDFVFDNSLRYAENHDEVRLASPLHWGGHGMQTGKPVTALLFALSRGPLLLYSGQEVGEPASGAEGFGGDDGRTTIYDYWSMPEFAKWFNGGACDGGRLSSGQKSLREYYRRLLHLADLPAFRDGAFYPLNPDNAGNADYGSGQWIYSFLRYDAASGQRMLVVANLHPAQSMKDLRVRFSGKSMRFLGWDTLAGSRTVRILAGDRLGEVAGDDAAIRTTPAEMENPGLPIKELQPLTAAYYELRSMP